MNYEQRNRSPKYNSLNGQQLAVTEQGGNRSIIFRKSQGTIVQALGVFIAIFFAGCAVGPGYSSYEWRKPGGTTEQRDQLLAEARVHAVQAYPDPISQEQIYSEPLNAPAIRRAKRESVIIDFMASKGWKFVLKSTSPSS